MKRTLFVMCACLFMCSACKNYRNTSIFTTISESQALSDGDSLFLHAYQCVEDIRPHFTKLSIHQKSQFSQITYSDVRRLFQETSDPALYNQYMSAWEMLYSANEKSCDSLLTHYRQICNWEQMTAEQQIGWRYYFTTNNIAYDPINGWTPALQKLLVPPVVINYWRYPQRKDQVIRELVNPQYLNYQDFYTQQRFPALFELRSALGDFD